MKFKPLFISTILALASCYSHAEVYLAVAGGLTNVGMSEFDDSGSYSLAAGLDLTDYLAVEVAYIDLIDSDDDSLPGKDLSVDGINLSTVIRATVYDKLGVYGKAGIYTWDAVIKDFESSSREKDDGTNLSIGFGLDYAFNEKITAQLGLHKFKLDDDDAETVFLGLQFGI